MTSFFEDLKMKVQPNTTPFSLSQILSHLKLFLPPAQRRGQVMLLFNLRLIAFSAYLIHQVAFLGFFLPVPP